MPAKVTGGVQLGLVQQNSVFAVSLRHKQEEILVNTKDGAMKRQTYHAFELSQLRWRQVGPEGTLLSGSQSGVLQAHQGVQLENHDGSHEHNVGQKDGTMTAPEAKGSGDQRHTCRDQCRHDHGRHLSLGARYQIGLDEKQRKLSDENVLYHNVSVEANTMLAITTAMLLVVRNAISRNLF